MKNLDVSGFDLRNMRYTGESTQRHEYLWEVIIDKFETELYWRRVEIQFAKTWRDPDLVRVENIFYKDGWVNSYWLPNRSVNAWLLTTKPLEYTEQVPHSIKYSGRKYRGYTDIRPFTQENPLVRAYKYMQYRRAA
jgi:hypothetical protein